MALVSDQDIELLMQYHKRDLPLLEKLDRYHTGNHDVPFMPKHANAEYKKITSRCYTNFMRQAVAIPTQTLFVDGFRMTKDGESPAQTADGPEWAAFQRSRGDAIQLAIYSGAFVFGYSLIRVQKDPKTQKARLTGISALRSSAIFDDPANDIVPRAAMEILSEPTDVMNAQTQQTRHVPGKARIYGPTHEEIITWDVDASDNRTFKRVSAVRHGFSECPITRLSPQVDLEGRCIGIVEPLIDLQDRLNQSVHDLLIAQVYTSFQVRTATGMVAATKQEPVFEKDFDGNIVYDEATGHPVVLEYRDVLDRDGNPILQQANLSAAHMLISEDEKTKFGVLPGAPLDGFIASIEMSLRHFAALSATPPHYMMGSITNISADALQAAEIALKRKIDTFKVMFGEAWERSVSLAAEYDEGTEMDFRLETVWRDMEGQSFAKMADALLKLKELNVPAEGLWSMLPGVSANQLKNWQELIVRDPDQILSAAVAKGNQATRPDGAQPNDPNAEQKQAQGELI